MMSIGHWVHGRLGESDLWSVVRGLARRYESFGAPCYVCMVPAPRPEGVQNDGSEQAWS